MDLRTSLETEFFVFEDVYLVIIQVAYQGRIPCCPFSSRNVKVAKTVELSWGEGDFRKVSSLVTFIEKSLKYVYNIHFFLLLTKL